MAITEHILSCLITFEGTEKEYLSFLKRINKIENWKGVVGNAIDEI